MFAKFLEFGSARQVLIWFMEHELAIPARTMEGDVHWRRPAYGNIYRVLTNPAYGGAYAYGKTQSLFLYESGTSRSRRRRRDRDRWVALIPSAHDGYVEWEMFERIQKMIRHNRFGGGVSGAAREGAGLLGGVLRCRRCGRMLRVYYKGNEGNFVRYACSRIELDTKEARCIAFSGATVDPAVARELLRVVEPAAIEAAVLASEQEAQVHSEVVAALRRDLEAASYRVLRAQRQYESTDPDNRLVARELEHRWNLALEEKQAIELRIAEESGAAAPSGCGTLEQLQTLATDLENLWNNERTDERTKKRLLRALIREIVVDVDDGSSEIVLLIHWKGGVHTPLRVPRRRRGQRSTQTPKDIIEAVRSLSRICNDQMIAGVLNRAKSLTGNGNFWSRALITSLRHRNAIECHDAQRQAEQGWINLSEAAQLLGTSRNTLRDAIERGDIAAERPMPCGPWILNKKSLQSEGARRFIERVRSAQTYPTRVPSEQCSLDLSTT